MQRARRISIWIGGVAVAMAAVLGLGLLVMTSKESTQVQVSYAVSLEDPRAAAGWANDVFVGRVTDRLGSTESPVGIRSTLYRVEVLSTLKGKVSGTVRVGQVGDEDVRLAGTSSLRSGETYVLVSRLNTRGGWHNVPGNFDPVQVSGPDDPRVHKWKKAARNGISPPGVKPSKIGRSMPTDEAYATARLD